MCCRQHGTHAVGELEPCWYAESTLLLPECQNRCYSESVYLYASPPISNYYRQSKMYLYVVLHCTCVLKTIGDG